MGRLKLVALTISFQDTKSPLLGKNKAEHQIDIRPDIILAKEPFYFCSWSATFNSCSTLIRSVLSVIYGRSFLEKNFHNNDDDNNNTRININCFKKYN